MDSKRSASPLRSSQYLGYDNCHPPTRTPSPSVASIRSLRQRNLSEQQLTGFHGELENIILPPPPSLIVDENTSTAYTGYSPEPPSPLEDYPRAPTQNYRQSLTTAFLDKYNNKIQPLIAKAGTLPTPPPSGASSPTKTWASFVGNKSKEAFSATKASVAHHRAHSSVFSDLLSLNGSSAPISLGILPSERSYNSSEADSDLAYGASDMESVYTSSRRSRPRLSTCSTSSQHSSASGKIGSWFAARTSTTTFVSKRGPTSSSPTLSTPLPSQDPLLTLDVNAALFPHGPADPLNPSHFHDLLSNAEALISRLQSAYKAQSIALRDLQSEAAAVADEADEAETRARHLKVQLEDMGRRVTGQEDAMRELAGELELERRKRQEEGLALRRRGAVRAAGLGVQPARKRGTGAAMSVSGFSDSGFESGGESDAISVEGEVEESIEYGSGLGVESGRRSKFVQNAARTGMMPVGGLETENRMLRARVAELEDAVDSCLDMVTSPWAIKA